MALEGRTNEKASRCEGPKARPKPTVALARMTKKRTKRQGATTAVATLDWQATGRRPKAPNRSECLSSLVCGPGKEDLWTGQSPDAENRTSGGVGGCRGAIPGTRPDRGPGFGVATIESDGGSRIKTGPCVRQSDGEPEARTHAPEIQIAPSAKKLRSGQQNPFSPGDLGRREKPAVRWHSRRERGFPLQSVRSSAWSACSAVPAAASRFRRWTPGRCSSSTRWRRPC